MMVFWIALVWLIGVHVSPALAQLYRWTDDTGKVHITDNPETIPPAYRDRAQPSSSDAPASGTKAGAPSRPPSAPSRPPARAPAASQGTAVSTTQQIQALQGKIAAARRERQTSLEQLRSQRTIHTTPEFVRQRRQIATMMRALVTVEQQLDALQTQLEEAQKQLQAQQTPSIAQPDTEFDNAGHDAAYWRRRVMEIRDRLRLAHAQRRDALTQLAAAVHAGQGTTERQGRTLLQQVEVLAQADQAIDEAEAALQALQQEARRAGAPLQWLQ